MGMVEDLLSQHAGGLVSKLVAQLGFDPALAERFVPIAIEKLAPALSGGGLDLAGLLAGGGDGADKVIERVDVPALAQEAGVDEAQARSGLEAIVPSLLSQLGGDAGGAKGLLDALGGGGGGASDLLGAAGKLGGLFGKS